MTNLLDILEDYLLNMGSDYAYCRLDGATKMTGHSLPLSYFILFYPILRVLMYYTDTYTHIHIHTHTHTHTHTPIPNQPYLNLSFLNLSMPTLHRMQMNHQQLTTNNNGPTMNHQQWTNNNNGPRITTMDQ